MSVMKKMMTLLRGSVREIGESVVDTNAIRICEQDILDAKHHVAQARSDLSAVMAKEMQSARLIEKLQSEIERHEQLAVEALDKSHEALADEVAQRVGGLDLELQESTRAHAAFAVQVVRLKTLIQQAETRIREQERDIAVARTTESVYRATRSIAENIGQGGTGLVGARESIERIRQRHEDLSDRMAAADQLRAETGDGALEKKLAAAGIGDEARRQSEAMERIRVRRAKAPRTGKPSAAE